MPSATSFRRGDVILVPFPFTDFRTSKQRPALVISAESFNSTRNDVLVAAITPQIPSSLASDEFLIPQNDLAACGLPKPSIIRLNKLVALHQQLVIKRLGAIPQGTLGHVLAQLRQLF